MKVVIVSAAWPPIACGVGDYSQQLSDKLIEAGIQVFRIGGKNSFKLRKIIELRELLIRTNADVVHVQYPAVGYGRSLVPAIIPLLIWPTPCVVTLHEYEVFKWYRFPWFWLFAFLFKVRLFSSKHEADKFDARVPFRRGIHEIVPIGSNVPVREPDPRPTFDVCHFGLITEGKGIDDFLDLLQDSVKIGRKYRFCLIGKYQLPDKKLLSRIDRSQQLGLVTFYDLEPDAVGRVLSQSTFAYLPYPNGATAKRGTLAACLQSQLVVITRHSSQTPKWLRTATVEARSPTEALSRIDEFMANNINLEEFRERSRKAGIRFSWKEIVQYHVKIYSNLVDRR